MAVDRTGPFTEHTGVQMTKAMKREIQVLADRNRRTLSHQIRVMLADSLKATQREIDPRSKASNTQTNGSTTP